MKENDEEGGGDNARQRDEHGNNEDDDDDDQLISRSDNDETNALMATRTTMTANCDEIISKAATKTISVLLLLRFRIP